MTAPRAELLVEHARVRRAQHDSRAHLESALARVSPAAVGVAPGALLVVRQLALRTPLGPGTRADAFVADLQERLRERLADARALRGEDLHFADEAELAAAVIASWLDGDPPERCGWRRIVTGSEAPPRWWRRALLPDARLLPRVVAALARERRAAAWITRLDPAEIASATRLLAAAHGITLPVARSDAPATHARSAKPHALAATIRQWLVDAEDERLAPPARALLALCLALERRPALTREATFPAAVAMATATVAIEQPTVRAPDDRPRRDRLPATPPFAFSTEEPPSAARRFVSPPVAQHRTPDLTTACDSAVETGFGGLFFLLNALVAMEVYGDFTRPLPVAGAPDPFDLLAALGRRWCGATFRRDPLDALLARLAGRAPDEPLRFVAPAWQVPTAWLAPWPAHQTQESWHPAGFPLTLRSGDPRLPRGPQARWTAALALYLQARLAPALDMDGAEAVRLTIARPAAVTCAGDRVTVTFELETHPLALRLAGLDRDPGYLPASRRDVRFVFA